MTTKKAQQQDNGISVALHVPDTLLQSRICPKLNRIWFTLVPIPGDLVPSPTQKNAVPLGTVSADTIQFIVMVIDQFTPSATMEDGFQPMNWDQEMK
jgi:hypothetical protein